MWERQGLLFKADENHPWMHGYSQSPIAELLEDRIRIYFTVRSGSGKFLPTFLEVSKKDPGEVLYVHDKPLLRPGRTGAFDDGGVVASSILNYGRVKYLYYVGGSCRVTVPIHLAIGLAASRDGGLTFTRVSEGPILDRTALEPYFSTGPHVLADFRTQVWNMWYVSCTGWRGKDALFHIKHAHSRDGRNWIRTGRVAIEAPKGCAAGRPSVAWRPRAHGGNAESHFLMWYPVGKVGSSVGTRIRCARSTNGLDWETFKSKAGLDPGTGGGFDCRAVLDPSVVFLTHRNALMFYHGDGDGAAGIGWAKGRWDG